MTPHHHSMSTLAEGLCSLIFNTDDIYSPPSIGLLLCKNALLKLLYTKAVLSASQGEPRVAAVNFDTY